MADLAAKAALKYICDSTSYSYSDHKATIRPSKGVKVSLNYCPPERVNSSVHVNVLEMVESMQKAASVPPRSSLNKASQFGKMKSQEAVAPEGYGVSENDDRNDDSPLKNIRNEGHVVLPSKGEIEKMSTTEAFRTYHSYLDNIDTICHRKLRMGHIDDGGWEICDDKQYRPVKPCIVYSFGINNDFSFDDDTAKHYECDIFSFDPSMSRASYKRSRHVQFLKMGISGTDKRDGGWELHTLKTFKKMLNHTGKVIDVLKVDVEMAEWPSLPEMTSSRQLTSVRQLLVEYHGDCSNRQQCINRLKILKDVHDIGFRRFYVHKNPACKYTSDLFPVIRTKCYEVHYVNMNVMRP